MTINNLLSFEVIRDGKVLMYTDDISCIYANATLKDMAAGGYTFRMNGKPWTQGKQALAADNEQLTLDIN